MEEQTVVTKKKISFAPAITFLCLEVLAIVAFNLGNSLLLYGILGTVLAVLFVVIYRHQLKNEQFSSFAYFLFPLVVFGLLTAIGNFARYDLWVGDTIFIPLAMCGFALCGYLVSYSTKFNIKKALIVVYSAIAVYTLINLFITMIQFVPFYGVIYSNGYIYYDGKPSVVTLSGMAYALMGFQVTEVGIGYFSLFPCILLTAAVGLLFINFKKDKLIFFIFAGFALLGFITLLFCFSKMALLGDIVILIVMILMAFFGKKLINGKVFGIVMGCIGVVALAGIGVFFVNAQPWPAASGLQSFIARNGFLNRLFNMNDYSMKYKPVFADLFSGAKLFGFPNNADLQIFVGGENQIAYLSGNWFVDNFMTSGIFGAIFFIAALSVAINYMVKYFKYAPDSQFEKTMLLTFVFGFLAYSLVNNDTLPFIFYSNSMPIMTQGLFFICIFFIGYACNKGVKFAPKKEPKKEEVTNEKAQ